jgi:hypothetical protein
MKVIISTFLEGFEKAYMAFGNPQEAVVELKKQYPSIPEYETGMIALKFDGQFKDNVVVFLGDMKEKEYQWHRLLGRRAMAAVSYLIPEVAMSDKAKANKIGYYDHCVDAFLAPFDEYVERMEREREEFNRSISKRIVPLKRAIELLPEGEQKETINGIIARAEKAESIEAAKGIIEKGVADDPAIKELVEKARPKRVKPEVAAAVEAAPGAVPSA